MASKPSTPLSSRRPFLGEGETTRLPILSPRPVRRSLSLRCCNCDERESQNWDFRKNAKVKTPTGRENGSSFVPVANHNINKTTHKIRDLTLKLTTRHTERKVATGKAPSVSTSPTSATTKAKPTIATPFPRPVLKQSPRTPPVTPDSVLCDEEMDSDFSCGSSSVASGWSCGRGPCEHNSFAPRNGTTFSGRRMKYVVHCSSYAGQVGPEYLTPTQRASRHIRYLRDLLEQARMNIDHRDNEIVRLTHELTDLRLFKASLLGGDVPRSPEDRSNSSEAVTVRENNDPKTSTDISPIVGDHVIDDNGGGMGSGNLLTAHLTEKLCRGGSSMADSGHFDDNSSSASSQLTRQQQHLPTTELVAELQADSNNNNDSDRTNDASNDSDEERSQMITMYEQRLADLIREHDNETMDMRQLNNCHVEALLQKLADSQSRYADLLPDHEQAKDRIRELEQKLEELENKLALEEDEKNKMYLTAFAKERGEADIVVAGPSHAGDGVLMAAKKHVSVADLVKQLQATQDELDNVKDLQRSGGDDHTQTLLSAKEAISLWLVGARKTMYQRLVDSQKVTRTNVVDPQVTLNFLKSAIYYFLTDKENSHGHLAAIESILGFSDAERLKIASMNR